MVHSPVRPGAGRGPRQPGSCPGARLRRRPLQDHGVRAVRRAGRPRRRACSPSATASPRSRSCTGPRPGKVVLITVLGGIGTLWGGPVGRRARGAAGGPAGVLRLRGGRHRHRRDLRRSWCCSSATASGGRRATRSTPSCASAARLAPPEAESGPWQRCSVASVLNGVVAQLGPAQLVGHAVTEAGQLEQAVAQDAGELVR